MTALERLKLERSRLELERLRQWQDWAQRELLDNSIPVPFSGCRLWLGEISNRGYGLWRGHQAHRESYRAFRGEIPIGLLICHHCDVKLCVEPTHLYVGTHGDNVRDAWMRSPKMQQIRREGLLGKRPRINGRWVAAGVR